MAEMTGQPIPGGPSIIIKSFFLSSAISFALFLTTVTSFPEASSAVLSLACDIGPKRVSEI